MPLHQRAQFAFYHNGTFFKDDSRCKKTSNKNPLANSFQFRKGHRAQPPLLIPGEGKQIVETASEPVPHAVFGDPGEPRPVIHRYFKGPQPVAVHEQGEKTVQSIEGEQAVQRRTFEGAYRVAGVADPRARPVPQKARIAQPVSRKSTPNIFLRAQRAIFEETRLTKLSRRASRMPLTKSTCCSSAKRRGRSAGSFCRSPSSVATIALDEFRRPVQSAALWPLFRACLSPRTRPSSRCASSIFAQVPSVLASSTNTNS